MLRYHLPVAAVATSILSVMGAWGAPRAEAQSAFDLTLEFGPELDTNALRAQGPGSEKVVSGLGRAVASGALRYSSGWQRLWAAAGGGAKLYWAQAARPADEMVGHAYLRWDALLGRVTLGAEASYYDAFQRRSFRDFRTGLGSLRLGLATATLGLLEVHAGYRGLAYKPNAAYSFGAARGGVDLWRGFGPRDPLYGTHWRAHLSYDLSRRFFRGNELGAPEPCGVGDEAILCQDFGEQARRDLLHRWRAQLDFVGDAVAAVWYGGEANRSGSFGESYIRHLVGLKFTAPLGWSLFFTAKGVLQVSHFDDPFVVSQVSNETFATLDDENRSTLVAQLSCDLSERWLVHLRYTVQVNETLSSGRVAPLGGAAYLRQIVFIGARFHYQSDD